MVRKVGYQGVPGAYSSIAAAQRFPSFTSVGFPTFDAVIAALRGGDVTYALLPIENSTSGRVADLHHLLPDSGLSVIGEHFLPIHHCLIARRGIKKADVRHVYSHREALNQCRSYIRSLAAEPVPYGDTAAAVDYVIEHGSQSYAALASSAAVRRQKDAVIIERNVEDRKDNVTRFLILSKRAPRVKFGDDVLTSIVYSTRDVPAALFKSLAGFATTGTNIIKLESFVPMIRHTHATFYLEFEGDPSHSPASIALDELRFYARELTVLGSYPKSPFRKRFARSR